MKLGVRAGKIDEIRTELLVVGRFEGKHSLSPSLGRINRKLRGMIKENIDSGEFSGKPNEIVLLHTMGLIPASRVMLVGLGKKDDFKLDTLRKAMATAATRARGIGASSVLVDMDGIRKAGPSVELLARTMVEGAILGLYRFTEFKKPKDDEKKEIKALQIVSEDSRVRSASRKGLSEGEIVGETVCYVRDINSRPGNYATPEYLARQSRSIARKYGLSCKVLNMKEIERLKMGGILAVGSGSRLQSKLIVLQHKGGRSTGEHIVFVGKGITFDSGGISLKPGLDMDKMKYDKSGGVTVMGVMGAVARLGIPINVTGIIPAVENLPGGSAYRPGDILTTYSGKTVEVMNTDAEGRLILADALAYGVKLKPSFMVDIATLTGACVIALGSVAAGVMGNNDELVDDLIKAGEGTGERIWRLPLWDEYGKALKSDFAELKNVGGREASVITAGMFLKEFVSDVPWAHLDIAGTAWADKEGPYVPKGPSGSGVRLFIDYLEKRAARSGGKSGKKRRS